MTVYIKLFQKLKYIRNRTYSFWIEVEELKVEMQTPCKFS
jgi:hypothetical protein